MIGAGLVALTIVAMAPASGAAASERPGLWTVGPFPSDLTSTDFPFSAVYGSQDDLATQFADLSGPLGSVGADGCTTVAVNIPDSPVPLPEMSSLDAVIDHAALCQHESSELTRLVLTGTTIYPGSGETVGTISIVFARSSESAPFTRSDFAYTWDNACYVLGSPQGFPGDYSEVDDYVVQGWNLSGDPSVDCSLRSLPTASTTTVTSATSTATPPPSLQVATTTAPPSGSTAPGAVPVSGTSAFTG